MSPQQKNAWFNVIVIGISFVVYIVLAPIIHPGPAMGAFGICGLLGLGPIFYRRKNNAVVIDERDQLISLRAQLAGFWIFWEVLVFGCMITWAVLRYYKHQPTITIDILPLMLLGGFVMFELVYSIVVLIQYGRSREYENV